MNYRNIPLLRVVCPFIIGIIITDLYSINLNELIVLILIFLFSMSILLVEKKIKYFQKTILFGIIIQILFIGFGIIFTVNVKVFNPKRGQALSLTVTVNTWVPISENLGFQQNVPITVSADVFCVLKVAPGTAPFHDMNTESAGSISVPLISKHNS